jgi:hypothetical protein
MFSRKNLTCLRHNKSMYTSGKRCDKVQLTHSNNFYIKMKIEHWPKKRLVSAGPVCCPTMNIWNPSNIFPLPPARSLLPADRPGLFLGGMNMHVFLRVSSLASDMYVCTTNLLLHYSIVSWDLLPTNSKLDQILVTASCCSYQNIALTATGSDYISSWSSGRWNNH